MSCYRPLTAYQCADKSVVFDERKGDVVRTLQLPCSRCIGCRLDNSRYWAIRCMHEAQMHTANCFVTLTYRDDAVWNLEYRDFVLFMKKLRRSLDARLCYLRSKQRIKFYMCGEYGEQRGRPHFHACLFGFDFSDRKYWCKSPSGALLYRSEELERLWSHGNSTVGDVTFESAAYAARYCTKKVTGAMAVEHYRHVDVETGEVLQREPEFNSMSLRSPVGLRWLERFRSDVYPHGLVVVNGVEVRPPRFYDERFKEAEPEAYEVMLCEREKRAKERFADNSPERLLVKEKVAKAKAAFLKRNL